jgi:hypothetical protein
MAHFAKLFNEDSSINYEMLDSTTDITETDDYTLIQVKSNNTQVGKESAENTTDDTVEDTTEDTADNHYGIVTGVLNVLLDAVNYICSADYCVGYPVINSKIERITKSVSYSDDEVKKENEEVNEELDHEEVNEELDSDLKLDTEVELDNQTLNKIVRPPTPHPKDHAVFFSRVD